MKKFAIFFTIVLISSAFGWLKYEGNPVLGPVSPWAWMALADPSMIALEEGGYYMVYTAAGADTSTGETLTRPGAAWSDNGFDWIMSEGPVIVNGIPGTWDSAAVETPGIVSDGDSILLYYSGEREHGGGELAIGLAVSHDGGYSYERVGEAPIITRDTTLFEESRSIESPTVIRMGDSLIMWYTAQSIEWKLTVCRAASYDGVNWFRHPDNPVLDVGEDGEFDEWGVYAPCVRQLEDSLLVLVYNGFMLGESTYVFDSTFLGYATSTDKGVTWTKAPENPVLGPGPSGSWDENGPKTPTFDFSSGELIGCYWNAIDGQLGMFTHDFMGIEEERSPGKISLRVYPNPFNSYCRIDLSHLSFKRGAIEIIDVAGRKVAEIIVDADIQEYHWQPNQDLSSGVYFLRATIDKHLMNTATIVYLK